jgi:hypothetical protein
VTDADKGAIAPHAPGPPRASAPLPPELEARIAAFEVGAPRSDFDGASWFWMILLGVAMPAVLLALGWWA